MLRDPDPCKDAGINSLTPTTTTLLVGALLIACASAQPNTSNGAELNKVAFIRPAPIVVRNVGLAQPQAAIRDSESDTYLVSNVNGDPAKKDDNGFISKIGPDGKVIDLKWIDGSSDKTTLNAPKGMAINDKRLFVADIDVVRIFDRTTGAALGAIQIPKATYLDGVSIAPNETLYVSDTGLKQGETALEPSGREAIYQISKFGSLKTLTKKRDELHQPTGLAADNDGVWVASWLLAELYRIDKNGKRSDPVQAPSSQLSGLVRLPDGTLLLSSWQKGAVYVGHPGETFTLVTDKAASPGEVGYDVKRRRALIPLHDNTLVIQELSGFEELSAGELSEQ